MRYISKEFKVEWIELIGNRISDDLLIQSIDSSPKNKGYMVDLVIEFMPTYIDMYEPGIMPPKIKREYIWPLADMGLYNEMKSCLVPIIKGDVPND